MNTNWHCSGRRGYKRHLSSPEEEELAAREEGFRSAEERHSWIEGTDSFEGYAGDVKARGRAQFTEDLASVGLSRGALGALAGAHERFVGMPEFAYPTEIHPRQHEGYEQNVLCGAFKWLTMVHDALRRRGVEFTEAGEIEDSDAPYSSDTNQWVREYTHIREQIGRFGVDVDAFDQAAREGIPLQRVWDGEFDIEKAEAEENALQENFRRMREEMWREQEEEDAREEYADGDARS